MGYARGGLREYTTFTPLNRLVDGVPPESETAREFNELATMIASGKASPKQWQHAREWLALWRDNDAKLQPTLKNSELTAELIPVSQTLSQVSAIGLQALDDIEKHHVPDAATQQSNQQALKSAEKPEAALRDMIVPSVELLVQASGKQ
jgi:hexosaminidase